MRAGKATCQLTNGDFDGQVIHVDSNLSVVTAHGDIDLKLSTSVGETELSPRRYLAIVVLRPNKANKRAQMAVLNKEILQQLYGFLLKAVLAMSIVELHE
ncbi:hypothetical protein ACVR05_05425 [Streptococcus caprae]|uniref:Uncharacterized protein n=1 Tax=Streptococcus caprae TaxID=1640501 RepID=A0ABV8CUC7_9STRE